MRHSHFVLCLIAIAAMAIACDNDPNSPATGPQETGTIYGTIEVYDEHFKPTADLAGVTTAFHDTDGNTFIGVTDNTGMWEIELPLGSYVLDTIKHSSLIQQTFGSSVLPFGARAPLDWLGKGRREVIRGTRFCPDTLKDIVELRLIDSHLDSIFIKGDSSQSGHFRADEYYIVFNCSIERQCWDINSQEVAVLMLNNGDQYELKRQSLQRDDLPYSTVVYSSKRLPIDWDKWPGGRIEMKAWAKIEQRYFRPSDENIYGWSSDSRVIPSDTTYASFDVN